ncbi:MAG: hypothetical protein ACTSQY_10515 [Candidatus Odinarchaeia archaeon]
MNKIEAKAVIGEYKGHPTIVLSELNADRYPTRITLGLAKAKLIMAAIARIEEFIENNGKEVVHKSPMEGGNQIDDGSKIKSLIEESGPDFSI